MPETTTKQPTLEEQMNDEYNRLASMGDNHTMSVGHVIKLLSLMMWKLNTTVRK